MCGIAGIIGQKEKDRGVLERMLSRIAHRGPEYQGIWESNDKTAMLGHRRLAIIDPTPAGRQPMHWAFERFTITFNGEIYNYRELKQELEQEGVLLATNSDTEVLLALYERFGKECVHRLNGMFSFAIWDEKEKTLFAARDRIGEKPFKYWFENGTLVFASEIKAILEYPNVKRIIDWQAIDCALSMRFIPSPRTGFAGIHKLPAGHTLEWKKGSITIRRYWNIPEERTKDGYGQCVEKIRSLFDDSIKKRMISDVPLGAFLSGGLDSTSVAAFMARHSKKPIKTFVISMDGESEDQKYARFAAKELKTDHYEIAISDIDYMRETKELLKYYDEPFFDQSALPTTIISRYIKKEVTVVLSGDGGDELFGGYDSYRVANVLSQYHTIPKKIREMIARRSFPNAFRYRAEIMASDFFEAYINYYALWKEQLLLSKRYITKGDLYLDKFKNVCKTPLIKELFKERLSKTGDVANNAMSFDIFGRLADGYLTKTDIGTMASALELRPPFLDYRLVEYAATIPSSWKLNNGGKGIWKDAIKHFVPSKIIRRKKVGFGIPLDRIIHNQLSPLVNELLEDPRSALYEMIDQKVTKRVIVDHANQKADYSNHLWSLVMLELWIRTYIQK